MTRFAIIFAVLCSAIFPLITRADDLLYHYEGDVVPYDPAAGWVQADPCIPPCSESLEDGHLVLRWPYPGDGVVYRYDIARPGTPPPPSTLWVEWRFRSNHPIGPYFYACDARCSVQYGGIYGGLYLYGDAAISYDVSSFVLHLAIEEFHAYRFESLDGIHYTISVDGDVFVVGQQNQPNGYHSITIAARAGCLPDQIVNAINEWDFVRFGTISYGEKVIASDPPAGFVDAAFTRRLIAS